MANSSCGSEEAGQLGGACSRDHQSAKTFEVLATPYLDSLYNFACWLVRNPHDAEDLVQETYLKALRGFATFQTGTNFRAWIFRILKNTVVTARSKVAARLTTTIYIEDDLPIPENSPNPESLLIRRLNIESVQSAIEKLPPVYREVILLSEVEDTTYREIADILDIPIGTVMSRLARARKMIRQSLNTPALSEIRDRMDSFSKSASYAHAADIE